MRSAISHYRKAKGFSQAHLACLTGTYQSTICLIEQGYQAPSDDLLNAIAAVLEVSPAYLLLQPVDAKQSTEEKQTA